ncbi:MAG TPA: RNA methyltransferase [Vicinamibacteria bacterium]|nr:RNA methyltransferase [Vicinamibacteria bacterium]
MALREVVKSRSNPLVKRLRALREGSGPLMLLEGVKLVEEALEAGVSLREVAASPRAERQERGRALLRRLEARGVAVRWLDDSIVASLSHVETSQGVLALAERPRFAEDAVFRGHPLLAVAFGLQNPGNLGALVRAAEAAGATGALLTAGCADAFSWKALRGSMGSAFRLPQICGLEPRAALALLRRRGVAAIAASANGGVSYDHWDWRRPSALLLGAEAAGLPDEIEAAAEARVTIPMAAPVESLNVTAAAAVVLFEAARQRRS